MTLPSTATPRIPVSWGELVDKITILEIKRERIVAKEAVHNVEKELDLLRNIAGAILVASDIAELKRSLGAINRELWDIENLLREKEAAADFGAAFVALARAVYKKNDERAALKRKINRILKSELIEEKNYTTNFSGREK
jgi:hypothetical protein